tara:strand:- start:45 stop:323 length:279 start_codon:yes stop_codon:yes gene_type:complete
MVDYTKLRLINTMKDVSKKKLDDTIIELIDRFHNQGEFDKRAFEYRDFALKNGFHDHYDILNELQAEVLKASINVQEEKKKHKITRKERTTR